MSARVGIYLDSNAGAPLQPRVVETLRSLLEGADRLLPNPSSIHAFGRRSKRLLAEARENIARSLGEKIDPEQLVFTSSGSEANQLAIRSLLEPHLVAGRKPHWITTPVEHDSVLQMTKWLEDRGGKVDFLPVDRDGKPEVTALGALWRSETALVSALWVNNETGVITDVAELSQAVRARDGILHLDAAQAWGKLPIDLATLPEVGLVTFSGHKIGAPSGIGLLWVGRGVQVEGTIYGKQEKGRRGGTENVLGIVALGAAALGLAPEAWASRVEPLRNRLEREIRARISGVWINGEGAPRVANTMNLTFEGIEGEGLVLAMDLSGFAVSSGSACASGVLEPSHVLRAMGRTRAEAMSALRISLADEVSWDELERFVVALEHAVERVRHGRRLESAAAPVAREYTA